MIQTLSIRMLSTLLRARRKKRRGFFGWVWKRILLMALIGFFWYILVGPQEQGRGGAGGGTQRPAGAGGRARPAMRSYGAEATAPRGIASRRPAAATPIEEALSAAPGVRLERPAGESVPTAPPPFDAAEEEALAAPTPDTLAPAGEAARAQADDLALIEGIGPRISALLQENGIHTFADLANSSSESIEMVLRAARLHMIDASTWAEQARLAAAGDWDAFERMKAELKGGRRL